MRARTIVAWMLVGAVCGCGERGATVDLKPNVVDRVRLGEELLFVDASRNEVDAVGVVQKSPTAQVTRIAVRANPRLAVERSGGVRRSATGTPAAMADPLVLPGREGSGASPDEVLVLSDGKRDEGGDYLEMPALSVIHRDHVVVHYELSEPRGQLLLSSDARYALLWGRSTAASEDSLLSDANRVALIDLDADPSPTNPFERTLKVSGSSVNSALITPPLAILGGTPRALALFGFDNGFGIWDLTNPLNEDITVEGLGGSRKFALQRLVADSANAQLYMIQAQEPDLRVLSFGAVTGASNDFVPSWNQLPLGLNSASDMVQYVEATIPKVLVAAGGWLGIVQANSSRVATVQLAVSQNRLWSFEGKSPNDGDKKQRVLAWSVGGSNVSFVELDNLEKGGSQNIEVLPLGYPLSDLIQLHGNLMLTVLSGGGIGTLDLDSRRFRPLASSVQLASPLIESDARRVWVGGNGQDKRVAYFEPATLATGSVRLDDMVEELFEFEATDGRRVVVATHDSSIGQLTIVDGTTTTRANSTVLTGFLVDGLVSR